jgi:thiosulfate/3-mercaptopyruvate sulfurtransferase
MLQLAMGESCGMYHTPLSLSMTQAASPLISPKEIAFGKNTIIIDARSGPGAYHRYQGSHLQGALHADLDRDLSQKPKDPAFGGRHPLPGIIVFSEFLGKLGITPSTTVIVYDDKSGANAAARFWWMLRALGHAQVKVVDGGLEAIIREGLPMTSKKETPVTVASYPAQAWVLPTATLEDVEVAAADPDALVIDVREAYRYRGEREPIDLIAGHIPGAVNIPYLNNLTEDGRFLSAKKLAMQYKDAMGDRDPANVIVHCGSGVTACHTLLALEQAGIAGASLYVGSWGEWSRRDLPVGTGE